MLGSVVILVCLLSTATANLKLGAENFSNNWVPISLTQTSRDTLESIMNHGHSTQSMDLMRENAIEIITPPSKVQRRITFHFSTPDLIEDFTPLDRKQEFNGNESTEIAIRGDSYRPLHSAKIKESDYLDTVDESEKSKLNTADFADIYELRKEKNDLKVPPHSTPLPFNMNATTRKHFESSEFPTTKNFNSSDFLKKISPNKYERKPKQLDSSEDLVRKILKLEALKEAESSTYMISVNKKYEVTEPTTTTTTKEAREETTKVDKRYFYRHRHPIVIPLDLVAGRNALTAKLLDNLAKYNINVSDVLNNYDESKSKSFDNEHMFQKTFRFQIPSVRPIPFKYNSLNHLPTNPLLAAFLSNYGFYLRESFGRSNDYRNLYGYSASNNIHNNKPFGAYKVFSDTDSNH